MPKSAPPCFMFSAHFVIKASILIDILSSDNNSCGICHPYLLLNTCYVLESIKWWNLIRECWHITKQSTLHWCLVMKSSINLGKINHIWCMNQVSDISVLNSFWQVKKHNY